MIITGSVYVLRLEQSKYYVGFTTKIQKRMKKHFGGKGAKWTRKYRPVSIIETINNVSKDMEKELTLKYMRKYGYQNVRGYAWTSSYDIAQPEALKTI